MHYISLNGESQQSIIRSYLSNGAKVALERGKEGGLALRVLSDLLLALTKTLLNRIQPATWIQI